MADQASLTRSATPAPRWAHLVAIFFGAGLGRPGPGTWGSAATVLLWSAIAHFTAAPYQLYTILALMTIITTFVATPLQRLFERRLNRSGSKFGPRGEEPRSDVSRGARSSAARR